MKHNLLPLFGMAFVAASANAQTWTAPQPKMQNGPVSKTMMLLYNVEANQFLTGGGYWGLQASLSDRATRFLLTDSVADAINLGWTIQIQDSVLHRDGKPRIGGFAFRDNESTAYLDMGTQGHNFWSFEKQENGYYRIRTHASDATYGSASELYDQHWFGRISTTTDSTLVTNADPSNTDYTSQIDWAFVDPADFAAWKIRKNLYNALQEMQAAISELGVSVDHAAELAVYNNTAATEEEITAAAAALREKTTLAKVYAVLDGAAEDNPKDATSLLVNPNLDGGQQGWTNTFVAGKTAQNVAWQSRTDTNDATGVSISGFAEAWSGTQYGAAARSLGVGQISQTLKSLPAGKYQLALDATSINQDGVAVTGVQIFATAGTIDNQQPVATAIDRPEHFDVVFYSTGGDVTLGLRTTAACTANWIAVDNFKLTYFGNATDPASAALQGQIARLEEKYPDPSELMAQQTLIAAFENALNEAKNATENFQAQAAALTAAVDALETSIMEYANAKKSIDGVKATSDKAVESNWNELADALNEYLDELNGKYESKTLTSEEIAAIDGHRNTLIGDYISQHAKAGDDVTILLNNPGFDTNFGGWNIAEGSATPVWGGMDLTNTLEGGKQPKDLASGNAEVFQAKFDISQSVKQMPAGLYTLSCQAFGRDDNGNGITAELYAVVNGQQQTVKLKNLLSEGSTAPLFQVDNDQTAFQSDKPNGPDGKYVPNGMNGSNIFFAAGYYENKFNILVKEAGDITIGIRDTEGKDWVLFDRFQLKFMGNGVAAYEEPIRDKQALTQAQEDMAGALTTEALDKLAAAVAAGDAALEGDNSDACIAALNQMDEAIAFAEQTRKLVQSLADLYNDFNENIMPSVESSEETFPTILENVSAMVAEGADPIATNAEVEKSLNDLKAGWTKYVQFDALNMGPEAAPADLTAAILTNSSLNTVGEGSSKYWDVKGGTVGFGSGVTEIFNQDSISFTQTLRGLAPGFYRLGVKGFYRGAGYMANVDAESADTLKRYVDIIAGDTKTKISSLRSGAEAYNTFVGGTTAGKLSVPANMETANNAFENDMYQNWLQFEVKEGQEEVVIGLNKMGGFADDWLIFDTWTLLYLGKATPAEDVTTAIQGPAEAVSRTEIFTVGGTKTNRLLKGVNIIKTTDAEGNVRISKVLVR